MMEKEKATNSAKSVEEATRLGLVELGITLDDAEVTVIDEGTKGFLGIGGKEAVVLVTKKNSVPQKAEQFILDICKYMGIEASVNVSEIDEGALFADVSGPDMGALIGRRGDVLDAVSFLTNLVVNKDTDDYKRVIVDTENYRDRRKKTLENLAKSLAKRAIRTKKSITLEPMNPYERRIIHSTLQNFPEIETYSTGEDPNRKIVVSYKKRSL